MSEQQPVTNASTLAGVPTNVDALGDDLPPVQPPSAGFVFQLFVIPALIVLAVVGVWALFGQMAATETDWHSLVDDLDSSNPQISQRAMFGLAQLLESDRRRGEQGKNISSDPELITRIASRLEREFQRNTADKNSIALQVFLVRGLGMLSPSESSLSVITKALEVQRDIEIRKGGIVSLALVGDQLLNDTDLARTLDIKPAIESLTAISQESDVSMIRAAAFALGVLPGEASIHQLIVLTQHNDRFVAVNAAVGLARLHHAEGFLVFCRELDFATSGRSFSQEEQAEQLAVLRNVMKAVGQLAPVWNDDQRTTLEKKLEILAENHPERRIRYDSRAALFEVKGSTVAPDKTKTE